MMYEIIVVFLSDLQCLPPSLQCNNRLLSLRLSGNKIGNRGAMHLASMLQSNNTLQELEVADCDLVNTGFLRLCEYEHSQQAVSWASFSSQATQSVIEFSIMLKTNKTLCSVDISRPLLFSHQVQSPRASLWSSSHYTLKYTLTWLLGGMGGALLWDAGSEQQAGGTPPGEGGDDQHRNGEAEWRPDAEPHPVLPGPALVGTKTSVNLNCQAASRSVEPIFTAVLLLNLDIFL